MDPFRFTPLTRRAALEAWAAQEARARRRRQWVRRWSLTGLFALPVVALLIAVVWMVTL